MGNITRIETVGERVRAILAEQAMLDIGDITPEASLQSLGIDSLGLVEAIFAIEETFDISLPFNANEPGQTGFEVSSVAAITKAVEALIMAK